MQDLTGSSSGLARLGRVGFLVRILMLILVGVAGAAITLLFGAAIMSGAKSPALWAALVLLAIFFLVTFTFQVIFMIRRLHDMDFSGWVVLPIVVVPMVLPDGLSGFVSLCTLLVLVFYPPTDGWNRFGPDPRDPTAPVDPASSLDGHRSGYDLASDVGASPADQDWRTGGAIR